MKTLITILTALILFTSCNKETVEVVNPPVEVVQNYTEDIVGDWKLVSLTHVADWTNGDTLVQADTGWCDISERFTTNHGFGTTNSDCNVVMYDEISWSIVGDSLFIDGDLDCRIVSITDTQLITSPQPTTTLLYERVQ